MANVLMKGIDVSTYQKNVDYNKLKASGYNFVIIRAGVGRYASQKDDEFETHYRNAKAAGLHVGAYWYSYALTDDTCTLSTSDWAKAEANAFKTVIAGKQFDMPVFYDLEEQKAFQKGAYAMDLLARTFCSQMEAYGYWCGIYGGQYLAENLLSQNTVNRYSFWLAQYVKNPMYKGNYGIWQYNVAGADPSNNPWGVPNVPGVNGQCDMDNCYVDYPTQIIAKGLNGYSKPTPTPTPTPTPKVPILKVYNPRTVIPESGNKYYNSTAAGGYAVGTILGNPLQPGLNVLNNCVGYAASRFNEIINQGKWLFLQYPPNAEDFIDHAKAQGLEISQTPSLGSVIVWAKGNTHYSSDGAGHVAIVEKIEYDGNHNPVKIVTSESGYGCTNPFWLSTRTNADKNWGAGSSYTFLGFIKNPAVDETTKYEEVKPDEPDDNVLVNPYKEPTKIVKEGSSGDDVRWLQWYLTEYKYYNDGISGTFDIFTLGALLAFQFKNGLDVDGMCGAATKKALKNYITFL